MSLSSPFRLVASGYLLNAAWHRLTLVIFHRCRSDDRHTPRPVDPVYAGLALTATVALVTQLMSSYTCRFASVIETRRETDHLVTDAHAIPEFFGIWRVKGRSQTLDGYHTGNDECIAWKYTFWEEDGAIRASKVYSIVGTVIGTALVVAILCGMRRRMTGNWLFALCTLCLVCEALSALYFEILGAQTCYQYGIRCRWDLGAWYAAGAVLLWMITAIGFALYKPRSVAPVDDSSPNHTSHHGRSNNNAPNNAQDENGSNDSVDSAASDTPLRSGHSDDEEEGLRNAGTI